MSGVDIDISHDDKIQSCSDPILIIGAGIVGLTIAQACRKEGIPYRIFERDPNAHARAGWAVALHWYFRINTYLIIQAPNLLTRSLPIFLDLIPQDIVDSLPEAYVDPERAMRDGEVS